LKDIVKSYGRSSFSESRHEKSIGDTLPEFREVQDEVKAINARIVELTHRKEQIELHRKERRTRSEQADD
jgi:hypothetical protein